MASKGSPEHREGCQKLSQQVAELQKRVSILHQIQDNERLIDTMLAICSTTREVEGSARWLKLDHLDDTVPVRDPAPLTYDDK